MIMHITVHQANPEKERLLLDNLHRFETALKGKAGLLGVHVLRDTDNGSLMGLSVWESKNAYLTVKGELDELETASDYDAQPPQVYHLEEVDFTGP